MSSTQLQQKTTEKKNDRMRTSSSSHSPPMVPPDGGYGWVIVFATALIMFVNSSVTYCFGMVYVYLVQSGYSNTQVSLVPAMMNAITNLLAPVSTSLSRYYTHRRLGLIGSITISIGIFLCSFSNHIVWFYVCYGFIIGLGNSIVMPQGFLSCQKYFQKKRVASNGLSMLGGSLGFMTVPLMIMYFSEEYSYQGAFILWSGITLHGLVGSILFHPVQWHMKPSKTIPLKVLVSGQDKQDTAAKEESEAHGEYGGGAGTSQDDPENPDSESSTGGDDDQEEKDEFPQHVTFEGRRELLRSNSQGKCRISSYTSNTSEIFGTAAVMDGFGSTLSVKIENMKIEEEEKERKKGNKGVKPDDYCLFCGITLPRLRDIINFKLFKYPAFVISAASSICNRMVYVCFVTYLPSVALEAGIGKNSSYLLSFIAIFELVAKIFTSSVSDLGFMPRRYFLIMASIGSCISVFSITLAGNFLTLAICSSCYGFCVGVQMCVGPVLLVEYLGVKLLPYTYGLLLFLNGIGGLCIFALAGVMNDLAGNYLTIYLALSCIAILPSIMWCTINRCPNVNSESSEPSA